MNKTLQGKVGTHVLNPLVTEVGREAELRRLLPRRPKRVRYNWSWPTPPHVDPQKEATAAGIRLSNAISTLTDELTSQGESLEPHVATLAREVKLFADYGLIHPLAGKANTTGDASVDIETLAEQVAEQLAAQNNGGGE